MNRLGVVLFVMLLVLLPSSHLWADNTDPGRAFITICNRGSLDVDVATARQLYDGLTGRSNGQWSVRRWTHVVPGECDGVLEWHMERLTGFSYKFAPSHPVHIAFSFKDANGVRGAGKLKLTRNPLGLLGGWNEARFGGSDDYDSLQQSDKQICVTKDSNEYVMTGTDPASLCNAREAGTFLIPASIDWENKSDSDLVLDVKFGPGDRAIPFGAGSSSGTSQGPGTIKDLMSVLDGIILPSGRTKFQWHACIDPLVVKTHSWNSPSAATIKSLQGAINAFLSLHGKGDITFKMTESPGGVFHLEEYAGSCADLEYYGIR